MILGKGFAQYCSDGVYQQEDMENTAHSNMTIVSKSATLTSSSVGFGYADGVSIQPQQDAIPFLLQLKFWVGELVGLTFVLASSAIIISLPRQLVQKQQARLVMRDMIKRAFDVFGAVVGLVLTAPLWVILPILIKLDSRGPVFYSQTRIGVNRRKTDRRFFAQSGVQNRRGSDRRGEDLMGRPFQVVKFRTMVTDAEVATGPVLATKNDSRITRLGRIMRKTRMDEIPQFLNILKGDMSLVGPRPERPTFVRDLSTKIRGYERRLEVKPGLTGLAQVEHEYDTNLAGTRKKVSYDLAYIRHWSVWADLKIMIKTVAVVFTGKGAH